MAATGGQTSNSPKNLWPEPRHRAQKSDPLENAWHQQACNGKLPLKQVQELAYKRARG
jgi:hypothetical protein